MSKTAKRLNIEIKTVYDFECVACEILDEFLEDFDEREGLTREATQEDIDMFGGDEDVVAFMYTKKGMKLYERQIDRLVAIGTKLFSNDPEWIKASIESCRIITP